MKTKVTANDIILEMFEGVYFVDSKREIYTWNKGAEQITGFAADEVVHRHCYDNILNHVDENGVALCFHGCPLEATIRDGILREANVYLQHKNGHRVPVTVRAIPLFNDNDEIVGAMELFSETKNDTTLLSRIEKYRKESNEDLLTGIPNRRYIEAILESKIREFKSLGIAFGVLFLDIDNFKKVNDTYGHDFGDEALKLITKTTESNLRKNDFMGRWGGEEFIIVVSDVDVPGVKNAAEKIRALIETSEVRFNNQGFCVTVSVGATISNQSDTVETIVKRADDLMYSSKTAGKNRVTLG